MSVLSIVMMMYVCCRKKNCESFVWHLYHDVAVVDDDNNNDDDENKENDNVQLRKCN